MVSSTPSVSSSLSNVHVEVCAVRRTREQNHTTHHCELGTHPRRSHPSPSKAVTTPGRTLTAHPRRRSVITCLLVTGAVGVLFLVVAEIFQWTAHPELIVAGLLAIFFCGAIIENALWLESVSDQPPSASPSEGGFGAGLPA